MEELALFLQSRLRSPVVDKTGLAGYYLSRPTMETLYSGLDRDDIAAIGAALREAGVPFDVNAESTVVLTPAGQTAAARSATSCSTSWARSA